VLKHNEQLKPAMIALPTLHLTLVVMHIADDLQLDRYTRTLSPELDGLLLAIPQ